MSEPGKRFITQALSSTQFTVYLLEITYQASNYVIRNEIILLLWSYPRIQSQFYDILPMYMFSC